MQSQGVEELVFVTFSSGPVICPDHEEDFYLVRGPGANVENQPVPHVDELQMC